LLDGQKLQGTLTGTSAGHTLAYCLHRPLTHTRTHAHTRTHTHTHAHTRTHAHTHTNTAQEVHEILEKRGLTLKHVLPLPPSCRHYAHLTALHHHLGSLSSPPSIESRSRACRPPRSLPLTSPPRPLLDDMWMMVDDHATVTLVVKVKSCVVATRSNNYFSFCFFYYFTTTCYLQVLGHRSHNTTHANAHRRHEPRRPNTRSRSRPVGECCKKEDPIPIYGRRKNQGTCSEIFL
jgi:hypothetical protein